MPSITGEDSTSVTYAPHMYVLREGEISHQEDDYIFIGNTGVFYEDYECYGATHSERLATIANLAKEAPYTTYHIGVSAVEGFVGDERTKTLKVVNGLRGKIYLATYEVQGSHKGISTLTIPEAAKTKLFRKGLDQISTLDGHIILGGLGVEMPTDIKPINFRKLFNGTPKEQAIERSIEEQWQRIADKLRIKHGIE